MLGRIARVGGGTGGARLMALRQHHAAIRAASSASARDVPEWAQPHVSADVRARVGIIGGGVIGLAVGARLSHLLHRAGGASSASSAAVGAAGGADETCGVVVLEREKYVGNHTSSRNSEVIHAGLYYPVKSHKTRFCLRGRDLLYAFCKTHGVPHENCGKWVVACDGRDSVAMLDRIYHHSCALGIPVSILPLDEARRMQHNLADTVLRVMDSPTTGIVSSHRYIETLRSQLESDTQAAPGTISLQSEVVGVQYVAERDVYRLRIRDRSEVADASDPNSLATAPQWTMEAPVVVNACGVWSDRTFQMVWQAHVSGGGERAEAALAAAVKDPEHPANLRMYPARGHYFRLLNNRRHKVRGLIYPVPDPNMTGLGLHSTINMEGHVRFGPDVEYLPEAALPGARRDCYAIPGERDPAAMRALRDAFHADIKKYLDDVPPDDIEFDYCGIYPKITPPGIPSRDFYVAREDTRGLPRWVNCIGVESPGLTSSLAIGEYVGQLLEPELRL